MELRTERLLLRLPTPDDAPAFVPFLTDPEVMRFLGGAVPAEAVPRVVDRWIAGWSANGVGKFVVERRAGGAVLGRVGINVWDDRTWAQTRDRWGRDYACEAALAARAWAQAERGCTDLVSLVAPENHRSAALAERLGARRTRTVHAEGGRPLVVWVHA